MPQLLSMLNMQQLAQGQDRAALSSKTAGLDVKLAQLALCCWLRWLKVHSGADGTCQPQPVTCSLLGTGKSGLSLLPGILR